MGVISAAAGYENDGWLRPRASVCEDQEGVLSIIDRTE